MKPKLLKKLFSLVISILTASILHTQTTTPLDNYILGYMKDNNLPGVGVAIVKNGKLAFAKGYGYADIDKDIPYTANSIQEVASMSKPVTATALMKLGEQGLFQLDDPIDSYIPFSVRNPNYPNVPITFHMLLNHTSSIVGNDFIVRVVSPGAAMPLGDFLKNFLAPGGSMYNASRNYINYAPGIHYQYSNIDYALLGYLVERISGMPFNEYCNKNIFQPLCMTNTRWFYSELDTNIVVRPYHQSGSNATDYLHQLRDYDLYEEPDYPSVGLKTTVVDMSKFYLMHGNYGSIDGTRIIDRETEIMMRHYEITLPQEVPQVQIYECLGWQAIHDSSINKDFFGKNGLDYGVRTQGIYNITDNTAAIVFMNGEGNETPIVLFLDHVVKDTISTAGKQKLNCSYVVNACEHNSDYWKNHQQQWAINSVPMKLGTKLYYSNNQILDLLNRPDNDDASTILAKALITAKFNIAQGSELSPIIQTINAAMNLIGTHRLPYDNPVSLSSATGFQMLALANTLNAYNSGLLNTTSCAGSLPSITKKSQESKIEIQSSNSFSVFPNPSSSSTLISFNLPRSEKVLLRVYDMNGKLISTITNKEFIPGIHQIKWNTVNMNAGMYILKMETTRSTQAKKIVIIK